MVQQPWLDRGRARYHCRVVGGETWRFREIVAHNHASTQLSIVLARVHSQGPYERTLRQRRGSWDDGRQRERPPSLERLQQAACVGFKQKETKGPSYSLNPVVNRSLKHSTK